MLWENNFGTFPHLCFLYGPFQVEKLWQLSSAGQLHEDHHLWSSATLRDPSQKVVSTALTPLKINSWNLRHYQLKMNIISTIHLHFWGSTGYKSSGSPRYEKNPYDSSLEGSHPGGRLHSGDASHQYQYRKESQEGQGALMNIEMISRMLLVTCNFGWCYDVFFVNKVAMLCVGWTKETVLKGFELTCSSGLALLRLKA